MKFSSKKMKAVTLALGSVMMLGAGQTAFAHASILNAITSGATGFSRIGVNHADNHTSPPTPIMAQSVIFPTSSPILGRFIPEIPATPTTPAVPAVTLPTPVALGDFFAKDKDGVTAWTTIANAPQLVQSGDIFKVQLEQTDLAPSATGLGNTIGWVSSKGTLQVNLHGEVPFRFTAPHFRSALPSPNNTTTNPNGITAADLCISQLVIQVAVADIADYTQQPQSIVNTNPLNTLPGSGGAGVNNMPFNLWVDNTTPGLSTTVFDPVLIETGAATPKLTINRDTTINPYPSNCVAAGGTDPLYTFTIYPSAADINALQYPGWGTPVHKFR